LVPSRLLARARVLLVVALAATCSLYLTSRALPLP
jgi:hypothetical protein